MLDMAIGIIIGAAFGRVISSFVSDIMMPPIGLISGRRPTWRTSSSISLAMPYTTLAEAQRKRPEPRPSTTVSS